MPRLDSARSFAMLVLVGACAARPASAEIPGVSGTSFTLTAKADRIATPDGGSIYFWGFTSGDGRPQYPGPTPCPRGSTSASPWPWAGCRA